MAFHRLRIRESRRTTSEAVSLSFEVPDEIDKNFTYLPGQHVTFRARIEGKEIRRTYSIASIPGEPLKVGVKRQEGGVFSNFVHNLRAGEFVDVMEPQGRFVYSGERNILLAASGSGITPVISIAAHALDSGSRVALAFGNRTTESIMFRRELNALKDRHLAKFALVHVLSRETGRPSLLQGRIDKKKINQLAGAGLFNPRLIDGAFICGPGRMISTCNEGFEELGISRQLVKHERFLAPGVPPPSRREFAPIPKKANIEVCFDGSNYRFALESGDKSVIDAALRQGIELPFSCRGGMCCTCRCRIISGAAAMTVNYSLEDWEIAAGFILACQSRPTSDRLILDFDAI
ncbi:MAG: 2Fe-2S iron-sulfur cluster-binding protein [Albidovulum sp.]|nr:2Fe-2S iron-sulfur cluster-binding protein [Albidovulum sp.]